VGVYRSSENLGESNESEEQVHGFECDGSHCIALKERKLRNDGDVQTKVKRTPARGDWYRGRRRENG